MKYSYPIFLVFSLMAIIFPVKAQDLEPFVSDGCSAFPDGTVKQKELWLDCCTEHDLAYWKGGTRQQRKQADLTLKECVSAVGEPEVATLMLAGVRVGGTPYLPTDFRWGYGWSYPRFYGPLTEDELAKIKKFSPPLILNEELK